MREKKRICVYSTDVGIKKKTNEDSLILMQGKTDQGGDIMLAAVCDGMGGLSRGELASATAVKELRRWFAGELPALLAAEDFGLALSTSWNALVGNLNQRIGNYGRAHQIQLGTTVAAVLLVDRNYYILNVGDSRVYLLTDQLYQLTHDQTLVQDKIDRGECTQLQAENDPQRSVLLQCVGASPRVVPDFIAGQAESGQRLLLCSDGFRHVVTAEEIFKALSGSKAASEKQMKKRLDDLIALNEQRGETDNITAILLEV